MAFLLLGAALRFNDLGEMRDLLDYDEAYNGLDALSLLEIPRFTPFFEANNGRESLWMYLLAPALELWGAQPFTLRFVAACMGILTLAAVYALARELAGSRAALWSSGALAVLYWHVHLSHLAFRALLYPLIGTLAIALLLRAQRFNRGWIGAGFMSGLLLYTYFGARLWVLLAGLLLMWWWIRVPQQRRGITRALAVMVITALPLALYTLQNPDAALGRVGDQATLDVPAILESARLWLNAWLFQGSTYAFHNPIGRPILDLPLALLVVAGLAALIIQRNRRAGVFIGVLALLALLPSLLSLDAPHFLRAIGLVIPVALVAGIGAEQWLRVFHRWRMPLRTRLLPLALILVSAGITYHDFSTWARDFEPPGGNGYKLAHTNALVAALSDDQPLYLYNVTLDDPVLRFMLAPYHPTTLPLFNFPNCTAGPDGAFRYLAPLDYTPHPDDPAAQWAQTRLLLRDLSGQPAGFGYSLYQAESPPVIKSPSLGDGLQADLLNFADDHAQPGDTLDISIRFRAAADLNQPYTAFIHLTREGQLIAQTDVPICPDYPTDQWQTGQAANQTYTLTLPDDLATGDYALIIGAYDSQSLQPAGEAVTVGTITVE